MFGMKSPQQVMDEEFQRRFKYLQGQRSGYQQAGAGIGLLLGSLFGGKSAQLQQAEDREQAYAEVDAKMREAERTARTTEAQAFVQDLTPDNIDVALRTEQKLKDRTNPFNQEIGELNQTAERYNLLADQFSVLGQPAEYVDGLRNLSTQTRMQALAKQREFQKFTQDQEKYDLDMKLNNARLKELQNKDKLTPKDLAEIQLKSTPESYQKWLQGKGTLVPNPKAFADKNTPAAIQEFEYFSNLPDDNARARYLQVKSGSNWKDLGNRFGLVVNGREIHSITKELPPEQQPEVISQQKAAEVVGKDVGTTKIKAPEQLMQIEVYDTALADLIEHPGSPAIFGYLGEQRASVQGTEAFGARKKLEQVQGLAFLDAIPQMKGLGALSDAEGRAITLASNALAIGIPYAQAQKEAARIRTLLGRAAERIRTKNLLTPEQVISNSLGLEEERTTSGGIRYKLIGD